MDRVIYLDEIIARRRRADPRGFQNSAASSRDAEDFETDDDTRQSSLDGLRVWISYRDIKGAESGRWVRMYRIERRSTGDYLVAHCELRDQTRTFHLDRIVRVADRSGETYDPILFFRPYSSVVHVVRKSPRDTGFDRALRLVDQVGDDLKVLAFMGEADGRFGKKEVEVLLRYAAYRAEEFAIDLGSQEQAALKRWIKALNPDGKSLRAAIARIASRGRTTAQDLWELSGLVVSADSKLTKTEKAAMEELRLILTEEFRLANA
jgi:hypothetical protein